MYKILTNFKNANLDSNLQAPQQTIIKLKFFCKGYFRQHIGSFTEILTQIKIKFRSEFLAILMDLTTLDIDPIQTLMADI